MAELDQQMMMEHRNKRKTTKYYRKLVEATKSGKGTFLFITIFRSSLFLEKYKLRHLVMQIMEEIHKVSRLIYVYQI